MPADETLAIIHNLPVARLVRAGFHEVEPWRSEVTPSQRFGGKRYLGKLKMMIRGGNARRVATRYDKTVESFLGFIDITSIRLWVRLLST